MTQLKGKADLSHEVFCRKNVYSLFCPMGEIDRKYAVYIPPRGEKAENSGVGIDCKNAADFLLAHLLNHKL